MTENYIQYSIGHPCPYLPQSGNDLNGKDRASLQAHTCMLNIFRDHSRTIRRLTAYQFGSAFLAILLDLAVPDSNRTLLLITSIFSSCFFLYLNHTVVWEEGAKSRIRADAGRAKYSPVTGLLIGIAAALPNILLGVLTSLFYFFGNTEGLFGWEWAGNASFIIGNIAKFWQFMYLRIIYALSPNNPYIYLAVPIPMILGCFVSYWLGLRQWKFTSLFKLKKKDEKNTAAKTKK